jgi:hypothetical protein
MYPLFLFINLQTHSAHRSFVDVSNMQVVCDMRSTKCDDYFDLSRYKYIGTSVHEFNSFLEAVRHSKCS